VFARIGTDQSLLLNEFTEWVPDSATRRKISDTALRLFFS
jgi:hypothetical protein